MLLFTSKAHWKGNNNLLVRINQDRDEGLNDPQEERHADIRGLIRASGMTFKAIAEATGLSPVTVSNYASGETSRPHDNTTDVILSVLGYRQAIVPFGAEVETEVKPDAYWPEGMLARREKRREKRRAARSADIRKGKRRKY